MKIAYVLHGRFPTVKAYGKQVAEVCAALGALKHQVTLLLPTMHNTFSEEPFAYYGLPKKAFKIESIGHKDATRTRWIPGKLHLVAGMFFYRRALKKALKKHPYELLYCRSPLVLPALLRTRIPVIIELHALPRRGRKGFVRMLRKCRKVVCLTTLMRNELVAWGGPKDKIVVEPDGVNVDRFHDLPEPESCKDRWQLPVDVPVIGYVGTLVTQETIDKGVGDIIEAFTVLQRRGAEFFGWIVGGPDERAKKLREELRGKKLHNLVHVQGPIPPTDVPQALEACDILVYPAPKSDHPYFLRDTSPLKLFEYLAAGKPIVAADLPPVRDVVSEKTVTFAKPGDPVSLADALGQVLGDMDAAHDKAAAGRAIAEKHGWTKRMARIVKL